VTTLSSPNRTQRRTPSARTTLDHADVLRRTAAILDRLQQTLPGDGDPRLTELVAALQALATAERQLQQQPPEPSRQERVGWEGRYHTVFEALPDACFLTDAAGVIREANAAASRLLGFARSYCLGKPLAAYLLAEDRPAFVQALGGARRLDGGEALRWEGRIRPRRHDAPYQADIRLVAIADATGTLGGFACLVRDVTA
jgi:PAS domain S-box-containing protein